MRKRRFSVEQMIGVLKQAELGVPVAEVIRKVGISEQTFYRWKAKYAGLEVDQVRQMAQLQEENLRLKKLVAELSLDKTMLQDALADGDRHRLSGIDIHDGQRTDACSILRLVRHEVRAPGLVRRSGFELFFALASSLALAGWLHPLQDQAFLFVQPIHQMCSPVAEGDPSGT
jgi:putative transposase